MLLMSSISRSLKAQKIFFFMKMNSPFKELITSLGEWARIDMKLNMHWLYEFKHELMHYKTNIALSHLSNLGNHMDWSLQSPFILIQLASTTNTYLLHCGTQKQCVYTLKLGLWLSSINSSKMPNSLFSISNLLEGKFAQQIAFWNINRGWRYDINIRKPIWG